ncbi:nitroreductase family protein [Fluviispira multicolorata]|uniref:Nitroreductase family protein n=1 Tax=Fluviispira multicolorata TaxID=2654512 RepID=A0A833N6V1_9BACT|nr:nitroreductase family protein [Fluviispira multicolorata]KAB8030938.1 nitroreductase family protein [Fluviispira multicolorata]
MAETIFNSVPKHNYSELEPNINPDEFRKVVQSRRSVRIFNGTPIPESIMNECLDIALLAPNSSNLQPWEFYWVRSLEKKNELIKACLSQPAANTAAELIVCVARTDTWKQNAKKMLEVFDKNKGNIPNSVIDYYKKLVPLAYTQGYFSILGTLKRPILFLRGLKTPTPRNPVSNNDMILWATKTCSLAAENLMLALRAFSFDSCPMEGFDAKIIERILELPSDAHVVMVIAAGKRAPNGIYGSRIRFERELFIKEV